MNRQRNATDGRLNTGRPRAEFVDSRVRLRRLCLLFAGLLVLIFGHLAWLQFSDGPEFRRLAAQPVQRRRWLDGVRGRILTRDGAVLAEDRPVLSVAVDYRWLADPPDEAWLRRVARQRLLRAQLPLRVRKNPARLTAEMEAVRAERKALEQRLAALCRCDVTTWEGRVAAIRREVTTAAAEVNARRRAIFDAEQEQLKTPSHAQARSFWESVRDTAQKVLFPTEVATPPARITIAEEVGDHVVVRDVPLDVVAEIEARPELYPATRIVQESRRVYPAGARAAHMVGHLGKITVDELKSPENQSAEPTRRLREGDQLGRLGIERQYDRQLRGQAGIELEVSDLSGRVLKRERLAQPLAGRDVVLTIDSELQKTAEELLDAALTRRLPTAANSRTPLASGGAIVAIDVRSGAVLAAASAPRFHPGLFQSGSARLIDACLSDPAAPLVDRNLKMALPPGSIFKVVTAIALLEENVMSPREAIECRGYFHNPEQERCAIFARYGEGHGPVTLHDALVKSCNVYFFHHAAQLGAKNLTNWANRLGFEKPTGIDLPDELAGHLPEETAPPADRAAHHQLDRELRAATIGQATVTATPMQVVRLMAAIANGGTLVTPHAIGGWGLPADPQVELKSAPHESPPLGAFPRQPVEGLKTATVDVIRHALENVVTDPSGSAHASVYLDGLSIAGKTGTAETGGGQPDHSWFAGYAPAESPRVAFVVVLEHGGGGAEAAGPVARRLVQRLEQRGFLGRDGGSPRLARSTPD